MKKLICVLLALLSLITVPAFSDETETDPVIEALKQAWTAEYQAFGVTDGYLEIKNTRVITIKDDVSAAGEHAVSAFGDIAVIYEFILMENWLNAAPYYACTNQMNSVLVHKDGTLEVAAKSPFTHFRARTYTTDFSGIIASIEDLGSEYNAVYQLLDGN